MPNPNSFTYYPQSGQYYAPNPYGAVQVNGQYPQLPQSNPAPIRAIPGRVVNAPEEIVANEVPMDGSISLFPKNDYSCIYAKQWNSDGTIKTVRYVPEIVEQTQKRDSLEELIDKRFDRLENMINSKGNQKRKEATNE